MADEEQEPGQPGEQGEASPQGKKADAPEGKGKDGGGGDADQRKEEAQRQRTKPFVRVMLVLVIILVLGGGFYLYWTTRNVESTDDAFTAGRTLTIAPHVAGYAVVLAVNDNQFVHEGQILARIDPRNYQATVDGDQAQIEQAQQNVQGAKLSAEVAQKTFPAQLEQARGQLLVSQGQEFQAETDYKRQHGIQRAATTQQAVDQSTAALEQARGQVAVAQAQVDQATPVKPNIGVTNLRALQQSSALDAARAQLVQAKLNLGWTVIRAPHDGWIAQRNLEQGAYVTAGQALFSLVEPEVWVVANFKETQLARMRAGQLADISVDAYPQLKLHGHVDSIQLGSGGQFSAFPPENATGNFVKIVQRVPVKILIDSGLNPDVPLPIGLSVEPTVHLDRKPAA